MFNIILLLQNESKKNESAANCFPQNKQFKFVPKKSESKCCYDFVWPSFRITKKTPKKQVCCAEYFNDFLSNIRCHRFTTLSNIIIVKFVETH